MSRAASPAGLWMFHQACTEGCISASLNGVICAAKLAWLIWTPCASSFSTKEMPTLAPTLRIRLKMPAASVRRRISSVVKAIAVSGTKRNPRLKPCSKPTLMIGHVSICKSYWPISQSE